MAMENKRITQLSTERLNLTSGDYVMVDDENNGSAKYRLDRLKETDTTLSVSGMAADAAATGQAIGDEATARVNAVSAEAEARAAAVTAEAEARAAAVTAEAEARVAAVTAEAEARAAAVTAEAQARAAADTTLGNDVDDLKSAMNLLHDEIPNTVQTYTFTDGSVSQVLHKSGNTTVRTDTFTYATNTITEVRTLNTGESLTIVTNLQTLETAVTYAAT